MHSESDSTSHRPSNQSGGNAPPSNWMEDVCSLIQSRLALIQLELADLAKQQIKAVALIITGIILMFFGWILILAGGVYAIAEATHWPWHWMALAIGFIHFLVAAVLIKLPKSQAQPPFLITRSEFQKDREWIQSLQQTPKSKS